MSDALDNARGFVHDRLTEADDARVEAVRDKLYAAPCGQGIWVSVKDGTIVHGNGGNEREQWAWAKRAPWIKLDERALEWSYLGEAVRERDLAREKLRALRASLAALTTGATDE